jgi:hypothetical protein
MEIPDHFHFCFLETFSIFASFFYLLLCLSKFFYDDVLLMANRFNLGFYFSSHFLCNMLMIFVGLLPGPFSQFAESFANLELAKLQLVSPIVENGLLVIVVGFEQTKIFVDPSHSAGEGILFVPIINS